MTIKEALKIVNGEIESIGIEAGRNNQYAARVIAAFSRYLENPHTNALPLIEAVMNYLAATGRAEGEGMIE